MRVDFPTLGWPMMLTKPDRWVTIEYLVPATRIRFGLPHPAGKQEAGNSLVLKVLCKGNKWACNANKLLIQQFSEWAEITMYHFHKSFIRDWGVLLVCLSLNKWTIAPTNVLEFN